MPSNLHIHHDIHLRIAQAFEEAWAGFQPLHQHPVHLKIGSMQNVTMRAQPLINWNFFSLSKRSYQVEIQPRPQFDPNFKMEDLPARVLVGWFAHELGHLMDYLSRPWYDIIKLGIAYSTLPIYKAGVERRADLFAIEQGFAEQIQATKKYILEESNIPDYYLDRINKYYMSPEEIEEIVLERKSGSVARDSLL